MSDPRYRCDGCGNLTRFDVTTSRTTKAFHHYTVGGELEVEETTVLSNHVDEVVCRWCGHGRSIVELGEDPALEAQLRQPVYPAHAYPTPIERIFVISIVAYDWNCSQHITPRFTEEEFARGI